jgi:DNA primase
MQDAKEEVRAKLNIEDVIGEYVQLKRAGRNFKGLSPFSGEKTPSFFVSPEKQIWHDFSSNKGGDVFSFVMEVEGLDFRSSLEMLARKAGVDLTQYESKNNRQLAQRKKRLYEVLELAASYFQHSLLKNHHALQYVIQKRGLNKQIIQEFRIGYAPTSSDALVQFLVKKGFARKELDDAGLTNRFGGDLFRGRMTVPLMDPAGRVVGFTARILADEPNAPKYLNTPQTLLYDKSRHVFGLSQAKSAIRTKGYAVIVEGNMDVVSSHQADVTEVVATAGTAMTEHHLKALRRLSGDVRLAFDGDKAGVAATERAIPIAAQVGVELTIIALPGDAKDPDELIQKDPKLWRQAIEQAVPAVDWVLDQYAQREDITTARGKRAFTTAALAVVRSLADPVERDHYEKKIASMTGASLAAVHAKLTDIAQEKKQPIKQPVASALGKVIDRSSYQDNILAAALIDLAVRERLAEYSPDLFAGDDRRVVARYLADHMADSIETTPKDLQTHDTYVKILLLKAETRYGGWNSEERVQESVHLLRQMTNEHRKQTKEQLLNQLHQAEQAGDDDQAQQLRTQLNSLIKEMIHG